MENINYESMFSGVIGQDYDLLKLICPAAAEMNRLVGRQVANYPARSDNVELEVVELGGGTGITALAMLTARKDLHLISIDNEPVMQNQAKSNLSEWVSDGRLIFQKDDALTALKKMAEGSVDIIASAYTLHNFLNDYRSQVHSEIHRVLKTGGKFINGDRYGLDDIDAHTLAIQLEVSGYFDALVKIERFDLLEHWIVHLFSDESENHVMRENRTIQELKRIGFGEITMTDRNGVSALMTAVKV
ncbi:MAG: class I SAM-dependent methyltransferase [Gammaproteobacteria bacterium]